jgi:hypothetical protein
MLGRSAAFLSNPRHSCKIQSRCIGYSAYVYTVHFSWVLLVYFLPQLDGDPTGAPSFWVVGYDLKKLKFDRLTSVCIADDTNGTISAWSEK